MSGNLDLTVGQRASRSMTVTADHVQAYADFTGDHNPLHFDEAFVARTSFGRLVAQGGIIGDTIVATATVDELHATKPVCRLGVRVVRRGAIGRMQADGGGDDDADVEVLAGTAWCYRFVPE